MGYFDIYAVIEFPGGFARQLQGVDLVGIPCQGVCQDLPKYRRPQDPNLRISVVYVTGETGDNLSDVLVLLDACSEFFSR